MAWRYGSKPYFTADLQRLARNATRAADGSLILGCACLPGTLSKPRKDQIYILSLMGNQLTYHLGNGKSLTLSTSINRKPFVMMTVKDYLRNGGRISHSLAALRDRDPFMHQQDHGQQLQLTYFTHRFLFYAFYQYRFGNVEIYMRPEGHEALVLYRDPREVLHLKTWSFQDILANKIYREIVQYRVPDDMHITWMDAGTEFKVYQHMSFG